MKVLVALFLVIFLTAVSAQNAAETRQFLGGAGATRCDKWIVAREKKKDDLILEFGLEAWVLGFVSGAVADEFVLSDFSEEDIFTRLDFYCRQHPSDILARASWTVTSDLFATKASRIRKELNKH